MSNKYIKQTSVLLIIIICYFIISRLNKVNKQGYFINTSNK